MDKLMRLSITFTILLEPLSFILVLGINSFSSRVINKTPLVGVSGLKVKSKQSYESAFVWSHDLTQQTRIKAMEIIVDLHFWKKKRRLLVYKSPFRDDQFL